MTLEEQVADLAKRVAVLEGQPSDDTMAERKAVVTWLRDQVFEWPGGFVGLLEAVERGDHRLRSAGVSAPLSREHAESTGAREAIVKWIREIVLPNEEPGDSYEALEVLARDIENRIYIPRERR